MKTITVHTAILASMAFLTQIFAQEYISGVSYTFYGFPNNGNTNEIAYDCGRGCIAQGSGTYEYPLTFATADGEFDRCEVVYSPYLRKYLIHEDLCVQCTEDWNNGNGTWHVDVWDMAWENGGDEEDKCDNALTPVDQGRDVIRTPDAGLEVNVEALYVPGGNPACRTDNVFPGSY